MRYHFEKPALFASQYGKIYICDHPVYSRCTLYVIDGKGLAVIQQRFDAERKATWWGEIDPWLTDALYLNGGFKRFFDERAKEMLLERFDGKLDRLMSDYQRNLDNVGKIYQSIASSMADKAGKDVTLKLG